MEQMLAASGSEELFGSSNNKVEEDIFHSSGFRAHMSSELADADDIFGTPTHTSGNADLNTGNAAEEDLFSQPQYSSGHMSQNAPADDDLYSYQPPPTEPVKSSALDSWWEEKQRQIQEADEKEAQSIKEMREKAQTEISKFSASASESQAKRFAINKEAEASLLESLNNSSSSKWENVCNLIDFNRTDIHEKDVSKMKSLLLQLKH